MTDAPAGSAAREDFGVYVHVPFCAARCDYCAFVTFTDRDPIMGRYVDGCLVELDRALRVGEARPATSCYIGGGTPSRLAPNDLARLVAGVPLAPRAEVTVECNPESTTPRLLEALVGAGVTRISFGAQSLVSHVLESLGRAHAPGAVARSLRLAAEAGIPSVSVDLIFGAAGERDADWLTTLEAVLSLDPRPAHVSAYALTIEPGTPLARDPRRHPDGDVQADRYELADELLSSAGLEWYEISNWAQPGSECRHNQLYWRGGEYKGIGCAAHSHLGGTRSWNTSSPDRYLAALESGGSPVAGSERLDDEARQLEGLALALRTREGVPDAALARDPAIEDLVVRSAGRAILTLRGRMLANEVAVRLRPIPPVSSPSPGRGAVVALDRII